MADVCPSCEKCQESCRQMTCYIIAVDVAAAIFASTMPFRGRSDV